jgi:hypothetical protein
MVLTDHEFKVPLDYAQPDGESISVFAREVVSVEKEKHDLPWLVFFQVVQALARRVPKTRAVG